MKSQRIRVRNLPDTPDEIEKTVMLKPKILFAFMMVAGFIITVFKSYLVVTGLSLVILAAFALFIMPDGKLCEIRKNYIVLYNNPGTDQVTLVYWDELMNWSYEYHAAADLLVLTLYDGTVETQEMYSRYTISGSMKKHALDKEKKGRRGGR